MLVLEEIEVELVSLVDPSDVESSLVVEEVVLVSEERLEEEPGE